MSKEIIKENTLLGMGCLFIAITSYVLPDFPVWALCAVYFAGSLIGNFIVEAIENRYED